MELKSSKKLLLFILLLNSVIFPSVALSGEFRVTPIRLEFDRVNKSGVVTVVNEGEEKLSVQMMAFEWTQDAEGKDQYTETNDIIFFPRLMALEKNEERVIRAGIKIPATSREKTYRLFIEEIPGPKKAGGVNVAITIRFGVPIFAKPIKEEIKGQIEKIELSKSSLNAHLVNKGNAHFIINSIEVRGKNDKNEAIFLKELSGWYLLSGASRLYTTPIPQDVCKDISKIEVEVKTSRFNLNGKLNVDQAMCLP
jgi:fimbrial chaperone protein